MPSHNSTLLSSRVDICTCEATPINRMDSGVPNAECERNQVCSELYIAPFVKVNVNFYHPG